MFNFYRAFTINFDEYTFVFSADSFSFSEQYPYQPSRCAGTVGVWKLNLGALDSPGCHNHSLTTSSKLPRLYTSSNRYIETYYNWNIQIISGHYYGRKFWDSGNCGPGKSGFTCENTDFRGKFDHAIFIMRAIPFHVSILTLWDP